MAEVGISLDMAELEIRYETLGWHLQVDHVYSFLKVSILAG